MSKLSFFRPWFYEQLVKGLEFKSALDIGCGKGDLLNYMKQKNPDAKLTGLDNFLDKEKKIGKISKTKGIEFKKGNALKTGFKNNSFDLVISTHLIEHVDALAFVKECKRVSKKYIVIATDEPKDSFWDDPTHVRPHTISSLRKLLALAGLKEIRIFKLPMIPTIAIIARK